MTIDNIPPTATLSMSDATLTTGETATLTITFSEMVRNFSNVDLTISNGTLTEMISGDEGITWTGTFTPTVGVNSPTNTIELNMTGVTDEALNPGANTASTANFSISSSDTTPPTATVTVVTSSLNVGNTSVVNIVFTEAVAGLTVEDLTVENGTVSNLTTSDGGINWTGTLTPDAGIQANGNVITLDQTGVVDAADNPGVGSATSSTYSIDTRAPTALITMNDTALKAGDTSTVTIAFNEFVSGFSADDLTFSNGTLSALTAVDEGSTWTATFTPTADISDTSNVITLANTGVVDLHGNVGTGTSSSDNFTIDTHRPSPIITLSDAVLKAGDTAQVQIAFTEAIANLTNDDVTVTNGTLSELLSSDGGLTYTATLTPNAATTAYSNVITVDRTGLTDASGNVGVGSTSSISYIVDTVAPVAPTMSFSNSSLTAGETSVLTISFAESVTGLTNADLTIDNGTLSTLTNTDGEGVTWTATFTPNAGVQDYSNVITLANTGFTDYAGNAGVGTTSTSSYWIDNKGPTATISMADSALAIGETSLVTITFSEGVTNFDASDLTVQNGTIGAVSSLDEGTTWTATFTPSANVTDSTNVITLNNAGVTDYNSNAGTGATNSANYEVDTNLPPPTPPAPTPPAPDVLVDGVKVVTETTTAADGSQTAVITIPTVVDTRTNTTGATGTADIPLVTSGAGVRVLEAGVPVGVGLQVSGATTVMAAPDALAGLIAAIEARTTTGSQGQAALVAGGSTFLDSLDAAVPMFVRTIVATAESGASAASEPLVIRGAVHVDGAPQTALVIDVSALPSGSTIQLQNVEFAVVIGAVRVTGGDGSQSVWGDGAAQYIVLGAEDDVLHGGAGDDTVGSAGGNDQIFGDEGNDILFGGIGNDMIDGGTGRDIVQLVGGGRADYSMHVADGKLVMIQRDGGADGTDTVSNVEVLRFTGTAGQQTDVAFNDTDVASLVRLYDSAFGRAPDEAGINFWIGRSEHGATLGDIAADLLASAEAQPLNSHLSNEAYVAALFVEALGRTGGSGEVQWWVNHLDHGALTRGETLLGFADSAEKIALVGVIDTSIETF